MENMYNPYTQQAILQSRADDHARHAAEADRGRALEVQQPGRARELLREVTESARDLVCQIPALQGTPVCANLR